MWSVLLLKETGESQRPAASHWQTLSHNVVSSTPRLIKIRTHNVSGDRHWFIGSCKSNYHTITTTTVPCLKEDICYIINSIEDFLKRKSMIAALSRFWRSTVWNNGFLAFHVICVRISIIRTNNFISGSRICVAKKVWRYLRGNQKL
jgi:hypothetical protein